MTVVSRTAEVEYTPQQMFNLVDTVEHYPQFIPACRDCTVHSRTIDEVRATLTFASHGMRQSFTTCNRLQTDKMIEIRLINGPFKQLEGFWLFEPITDNRCRIKLDLEFEFASHWLALVFGPMFNKVAGLLVDSFQQRAGEVYGQHKS